jgi:hypothetical protein
VMSMSTSSSESLSIAPVPQRVRLVVVRGMTVTSLEDVGSGCGVTVSE